MDRKPVRYCVCAGCTFAEIWESRPSTLEEIGDQFGAGVTCQSCVPYLLQMLATGETEFAVIER